MRKRDLLEKTMKTNKLKYLKKLNKSIIFQASESMIIHAYENVLFNCNFVCSTDHVEGNIAATS